VIAGLIFIGLVAIGFASVLAANADLFSAIKIAGALYLIWMGISAWRKAGRSSAIGDQAQGYRSAYSLVLKSIGISLSNPKAILSYAAVFSQFVSPEVPLAGQLVVLVPTAMGIVAIIYTGYCIAGQGVARLLSSARRKLAFDRFIGGFFVFAGSSLIANEALRRS